MKILFVCKWNAGRSQIAEELFTQLSTDHIALSAGTHAQKYSGKRLKDFAPEVVAVMKEKGIDVSKKMPMQLTPEMAGFADKIIILTAKEDLPDYLKKSPKTVFWNIEDGGGKDLEFHKRMRDQIEALVKNFVNGISR